MAVRLSNINLFVTDVARSAEFYATVFGLRRDQERSYASGFAYLDGGPISLTLQAPETPGAVLGQAESIEIGFETDDLAALRAALAAQGVEIGPTQFMEWGATFDARDPDGTRLTIYAKAPTQGGQERNSGTPPS